MYIGDIPKDTQIYHYEDLSKQAQLLARKEIINIDLQSLTIEIDDFRRLIQIDINFGVNDKYKLPYFIRRRKHCNKLSNLKYCVEYIVGNLCHFLVDGSYVAYMK